MKLGDLCPAPCFVTASAFEVPAPGCSPAHLKFASELGRDYYAVLLRNHDTSRVPGLNPRVAVVGLSPAGNQIREFRDTYAATKDYATASIAGAFAGLAKDIIAMIKGLGIAEKLDLAFQKTDSLARHPDIYVTSLVACASLTDTGSSDDFDPNRFPAARRCMTERFVGEMLNPAFSRLSHVLVLGAKGWSAIQTARTSNNKTVTEELRSRGKIVLNLPHPSGQNQEYVKLASLPAEQVPSCDSYVLERWLEYAQKPPRPGREKESEVKYKAKRATVWSNINVLRRDVARVGIATTVKAVPPPRG
jgi:hypothetical protein